MRTTEQKRVDELYETCCLLMEELGMKMAQLQAAVIKLGRPETSRLKFSQEGKVEISTPENVLLPEPLEILRIVCDTLSQRVEEVISKHRYRELVDARYVAVKLIDEVYGDTLTLKELGRILGGRDHSTVLHAMDEANELFLTDADFKRKYYLCQLAVRSKFTQLVNHKINQNG